MPQHQNWNPTCPLQKGSNTFPEICLTLLVVCHWTDTDGKQQRAKESSHTSQDHMEVSEGNTLGDQRHTGETFSVPTFWPGRHRLVCSQGHSSGERSGKHSYWLRCWWEMQCLEEGKKTTTSSLERIHKVRNVTLKDGTGDTWPIVWPSTVVPGRRDRSYHKWILAIGKHF